MHLCSTNVEPLLAVISNTVEIDVVAGLYASLNVRSSFAAYIQQNVIR